MSVKHRSVLPLLFPIPLPFKVFRGPTLFWEVNARESRNKESLQLVPKSQQLQFHVHTLKFLGVSGPLSPGQRQCPSHSIGEQEGTSPVPSTCAVQGPAASFTYSVPFQLVSRLEEPFKGLQPSFPSGVSQPGHHRPACVQSCTGLREQGQSDGGLHSLRNSCCSVLCMSFVTHQFSPWRCKAE